MKRRRDVSLGSRGDGVAITRQPPVNQTLRGPIVDKRAPWREYITTRVVMFQRGYSARCTRRRKGDAWNARWILIGFRFYAIGAPFLPLPSPRPSFNACRRIGSYIEVRGGGECSRRTFFPRPTCIRSNCM